MSKTVTPLESFTYLTDNLPSWLSKLDDLTAQVAEQNARFIRISQYSDQLKKKKHNSTESLRPNDEDDIEDPAIVPTDRYTPPNPSHKCLSYASRPKAAAPNNALVAAEIRRKRKPGSGHSNASGHVRYRTKSMVIVYYDSAIQDSFESIVRSIASARNTLRKGKTTASFKARMASMGGADDPFTGATSFKMMGPKMMRPGLPTGSLAADYLNQDKGSCFEEADKDLETAQSLCEVAAHQFLRDGDCRLEIDGTRKKFQNCLQVAQKEVQRLQQEDAKERRADGLKAVAIEPQKSQEVEAVVEVPSVKEYLDEKIEQNTEPPPLKQIDFPGTGTIEIDESSDTESIQIDLTSFVRTRRV